MGRERGDRDAGTRVWGRGKRGRVRTQDRGRGEVRTEKRTLWETS